MSFVSLFFWLGLLFLPSCEKPPQVPPTPETALTRLEPDNVPYFLDDLDETSLMKALNQSKAYYLKLPKDTSFEFGSDRYSAAHLVHTLDHFASLWNRHLSPEDFHRVITKYYKVYTSTGLDGYGCMLFTGYYEPVVSVSQTRTDIYCYPIYRIPDDLITLDLSAFHITCDRSLLTGRVEGSRFVPYYSRKEIDGDRVLEGRHLEIAWALSALDVFFLHLQGSGILFYDTGKCLRVGYGSQNGMAYRSIGQLLIEQGKVSRESMSMQAIKTYLKQHPEELRTILYANPSYVFFRETPGGPYGNTGATLTPGRSIATDARLFPKGALVFMESRKPFLDGKENTLSWQPFARFGFNQDTGGAITGPGRVDLFGGNDSFAELAAGYMKENGRLYFLVLKKEFSDAGASDLQRQ
jgi:membrane-bound lytic murein transglycosylase A